MFRKRSDRDLACSFCGRGHQTVKLIAGPTLMICSECVATSLQIAAADEGHRGTCSFCGKSPVDVVQPPSAVGQRGWVCGECLALCQDIVQEKLR